MDIFTDDFGLIHDDVELQAVGLFRLHGFDALQDAFEPGVEGVDDLDGVGTGLAINGNIHCRPAAVDTDDVGLNLVRVLGFADVADENRFAVNVSDGNIVDIDDFFRHGVGEDLKIERAHFGVARRNEDVVLEHGFLHVGQGKAACFQLLAVEVDEDASQCAAIDGRCDHPSNRLQAVAQLVVGDVVQFFFQRLAVFGRIGAGNGDQT
ncbi:MAG: hypothetical protein KatS3mg105_1911 [Gemmatales bacterium]|nr:MAG: hypothetical protein KatS3mg105_1911 [Gemmatales bacterium]